MFRSTKKASDKQASTENSNQPISAPANFPSTNLSQELRDKMTALETKYSRKFAAGDKKALQKNAALYLLSQQLDENSCTASINEVKKKYPKIGGMFKKGGMDKLFDAIRAEQTRAEQEEKAHEYSALEEEYSISSRNR